jgi:hypothetical protein
MVKDSLGRGKQEVRIYHGGTEVEGEREKKMFREFHGAGVPAP